MAETGWRTIETAPKDGRQVLLILSKTRAVAVGGFERGVWVLIRAGDWLLSVKENHASHWMPLPERPE